MMRIYPNGWLPPREGPPGSIEYKFVEAADHHDVATAAVQRLNACIPTSELAPIMKAWVEILTDLEDIRRGILIWHIMHSKRTDRAKWVQALNYANGRFRT